jgi:hypothetical protein
MKKPVSVLLVMLSFLFTHCSTPASQSDTHQKDTTSGNSVSDNKDASQARDKANKPIGFLEITYGTKVYTSEHLNAVKSRIYLVNQAENPFLQVDLVADSSSLVSLQVKLFHSRWYRESATGVYNKSLYGHSLQTPAEGYQIRFPMSAADGNTSATDTIAMTEGKVTLTTYQEGMVVGTFDGKGRSIIQAGGPLLPLKGEFKLETNNFRSSR